MTPFTRRSVARCASSSHSSRGPSTLRENTRCWGRIQLTAVAPSASTRDSRPITPAILNSSSTGGVAAVCGSISENTGARVYACNAAAGSTP